MDLLGLKAAQRKRDSMTDEPAEKADKPANNKAFFKPPVKPTAAEKAKSETALAKAIRKRDADLEEFSRSWQDD